MSIMPELDWFSPWWHSDNTPQSSIFRRVVLWLRYLLSFWIGSFGFYASATSLPDMGKIMAEYIEKAVPAK